MIKINKGLLEVVTQRAHTALRRRMNHNFHEYPSARIQRMLNAMEPGTYIRPHKHENPDKLEVFLCLKGSFAVVIFNNEGEITDTEILNPLEGRYGVEIEPRTWHSLIALEEGSVAYEVKDGPYDAANDKMFAEWSPEEESSEAKNWVVSITQRIRKSIGRVNKEA